MIYFTTPRKRAALFFLSQNLILSLLTFEYIDDIMFIMKLWTVVWSFCKMVIYLSKKKDKKIVIPIYAKKLRGILTGVMIFLSALALVLGIICLILNAQITRVVIEAGDSLYASDIAGLEGAVFGKDYDPDCVNHAGIYYFTVNSGEKELNVRLKVEDTKAPEVTVKNVRCAIGGEPPLAAEFIDTVYEPDSYTGAFIKPLPAEFKAPGEYDVQIRFTDASGNKTEIFDVKVEVVYDKTPPKIEILSDIVIYAGESISYSKYVNITDNSTGEPTLTVDDSLLDIDSEGKYPVFVSAVDIMGNKSEAVEITVYVCSEETVENDLQEKIEKICNSIIKEDMTTEQMCRAVYGYVRDNILYVSNSDKTSWQRAAYNALFVSGSGDCYSYFSASKAFFEYLGIENIDIQRSGGYTSDTHFWSLVNIGNEGKDVWYHYDSTRLRSEYDHSGCLLTDKQIEAYNRVRPNFYRYDKGNYPEVSDKIITPTPELEKYYQ